MWKHTRLLLEPDAKDGGASSTPPIDENAVSSTEKASVNAEDLRAELNKTLAAIVEKHEEPHEEPKAPEEPVAPVEEGEPPAEATSAEATEDDGKPPPFHEHPRWKEVQAKLTETTKEVETLKPLATKQQQLDAYCTRFGITEDQMNDALKMAALLNNDPAEAYKALQPIWDVLSRFSGEQLPDDLSQKVKDGLVDAETAKEMAALRARLNAAEKRREVEQKSAAEQHRASMMEAVNRWEQNKATTDPDFKQKAELVADRYVALVRAKQPGSPEAAVALAEQALADVNARLGVFLPKKEVVKPGPNGAAVRREQPIPKSPLDVARLALAKYEKD